MLQTLTLGRTPLTLTPGHIPSPKNLTLNPNLRSGNPMFYDSALETLLLFVSAS